MQSGFWIERSRICTLRVQRNTRLAQGHTLPLLSTSQTQPVQSSIALALRTVTTAAPLDVPQVEAKSFSDNICALQQQHTSGVDGLWATGDK